MKKIIVFLLFVLGIYACQRNSTTSSQEKNIWVAPETQPCDAGVMRKQCLLIKWNKNDQDWQYFYNDIEGFTHEKGYTYELLVREEAVENPPADASQWRYILVKVISKHKI
ncbi:DUF4377 domain-containing protein [Riemerella columbina]|uniref:DUF4377 domain-containing protein n=1 Tax=Riemerella columbina TaxID=103810 RepID=UPI00266F8787|nr:DUF4377 domain-containing protein [Riemerella columbina]WKS94805.1 DUF4377 domain-containing protein [Riemerella columbina]